MGTKLPEPIDYMLRNASFKPPLNAKAERVPGETKVPIDFESSVGGVGVVVVNVKDRGVLLLRDSKEVWFLPGTNKVKTKPQLQRAIAKMVGCSAPNLLFSESVVGVVAHETLSNHTSHSASYQGEVDELTFSLHSPRFDMVGFYCKEGKKIYDIHGRACAGALHAYTQKQMEAAVL